MFSENLFYTPLYSTIFLMWWNNIKKLSFCNISLFKRRKKYFLVLFTPQKQKKSAFINFAIIKNRKQSLFFKTPKPFKIKRAENVESKKPQGQSFLINQAVPFLTCSQWTYVNLWPIVCCYLSPPKEFSSNPLPRCYGAPLSPEVCPAPSHVFTAL